MNRLFHHPLGVVWEFGSLGKGWKLVVCVLLKLWRGSESTIDDLITCLQSAPSPVMG